MGRWNSPGKNRGKHETVHRDARRAVAWLDDQPEVSKVILGPFKPGSGRGGRHTGCLVFRAEVPAGLKLHAVTGEGLLELIVLAPPTGRTFLLSKIAERWPQYADRVAERLAA